MIRRPQAGPGAAAAVAFDFQVVPEVLGISCMICRGPNSLSSRLSTTYALQLRRPDVSMMAFLTFIPLWQIR